MVKSVLSPARLATLRLQTGSHYSRSTGVCAMEAVAWLAGEPHSDHPSCASPTIAEFIRAWNDGLPSDEERARLLKPLLPSLLDSKSTPAVELRRSFIALDWLVRECAPAFLDLTPELQAHAAALRALPDFADAEAVAEASAQIKNTVSAAVSAARSAAVSAAWSAAVSAAESAAVSAARSAAESAAESAAVSAARSAARSAAESAARSAAESAAVSAARSAARSAAESAAESAAVSAAESAAESAAVSAARSAARSALQPTVDHLQASALRLIERLLAERDVESVA